MSSETMIVVKRRANGELVQQMADGTTRPMQSKTDWAAFDALTEEEVTAAALSDPDNPPLTDAQLARGAHFPDVRELRRKLHMTQRQFAAKFGVPLGTLRDWEQGVRLPDNTARSYLHVIAKNHQAVIDALETP
jgi:putative transcriptional regulator